MTNMNLSIQSVETVEKVPFQKPTFEKWEGNTKKRLILEPGKDHAERSQHQKLFGYEGT
jgi:hypothetical protein